MGHQMILMVDKMATRYGLLPSEVMSRATTFDLATIRLSSQWEKKQHDKANGKISLNQPPELSQEQMLEMVRSVKKGKR